MSTPWEANASPPNLKPGKNGALARRVGGDGDQQGLVGLGRRR
ncbi:hypothetical protein [Corynebacterium matruchotii]|nr:hypothetical protein [Corynebacterium matruchotii]